MIALQTDAIQYFAEAAGVGPLSAILLLIGNLLLVFSLGFFGYLTVRGLVAGIIPG